MAIRLEYKVPSNKIKSIAIAPIFVGLFLHIYTATKASTNSIDAFGVGLIIWSWVPYLICALLTLPDGKYFSAIGGAYTILLVDIMMSYSLFTGLGGSTAGIGVLFMPFWNIVLFMPLGMFIGSKIKRRLGEERRGEDQNDQRGQSN